jgi:orotidine-5'-phosphate decarboxylase
MPRNVVDSIVRRIRDGAAPCVVGIDPSLERMPRAFRTSYDVDDGGLRAGAAAIADFSKIVVDAVHDLVPAVKLQSAYYEAWGVEGVAALAASVAYARQRGLAVILDAKRNDIAETAAAYAQAYLGKKGRAGALDVDLLTLTPYLGRDGLLPFFDASRENGKGVFVCVKTSNPGSADLQDLAAGGRPVYEHVAELLAPYAERDRGEEGYSWIGAVVGATFPESARRLRSKLPFSIFLTPGYGAQGADASALASFFNPDGLGALISASRSVTYPTDSEVDRLGLESAIRAHALAMTEAVRQIGPVSDRRARHT